MRGCGHVLARQQPTGLNNVAQASGTAAVGCEKEEGQGEGKLGRKEEELEEVKLEEMVLT